MVHYFNLSAHCAMHPELRNSLAIATDCAKIVTACISGLLVMLFSALAVTRVSFAIMSRFFSHETALIGTAMAAVCVSLVPVLLLSLPGIWCAHCSGDVSLTGKDVDNGAAPAPGEEHTHAE